MNIPWVEIGDFNDVSSQSEKLGGRAIKSKRINSYLACMNNCSLHDIGFVGNIFTWTNKCKKKPIFQRLDRAWVNNLWLEKFPDSFLNNLVRDSSDHCPIKLDCFKPKPIVRTVKPFRFEPSWYLHPRFADFVDGDWINSEGTLPLKLDLLPNKINS